MCPIQDGSLGLASGLFDGGARCLTELDLCFGIHDMPSLCAALYAKVGRSPDSTSGPSSSSRRSASTIGTVLLASVSMIYPLRRTLYAKVGFFGPHLVGPSPKQYLGGCLRMPRMVPATDLPSDLTCAPVVPPSRPALGSECCAWPSHFLEHHHTQRT